MTLISRRTLSVALFALIVVPLVVRAAEPPAGSAPALPLPSEQEALERQADRVTSLTHTAEEVLGPMPALAGTPFFGLAALSGVALLTDTETVRASDNFFLRGVRDNELVREARRYSTLPLFLTLAALALVAYLINSGKIRGAAGKLLRPLEDVSVAVVYSLLALGTFRGTLPASSGKATVAVLAGMGAGSWPSTTLLLSLGVLGGMAVLMIARFALDVLIWLIPVPWIDFLFETTKKVLSILVMALCFLSPAVAAGLALVCLLLAVLVSGWALRMLGFTFHVLLRPWLVRIFPALGHPRLDDEALLGHVAPDLRPARLAVPATALTVGGMPKRQSGCLVRTDAGLFFATRTRLLRRKRRPLAGKPVLVRTLLWLELRVPRQDGRGQERIALSRTLLPQVDRLRQALDAEDGGAVGAARLFAGLGGAPAETPLGVG